MGAMAVSSVRDTEGVARAARLRPTDEEHQRRLPMKKSDLVLSALKETRSSPSSGESIRSM